MSTEEFRHKLSAIFSADVVGYSLLMHDDEEATISTLTTYRKVIKDLIYQYRGRLIDAIGDNLLAEFTSAVDSVKCAVEIQRELFKQNAKLPKNHRMQFRIGLSLGDVVEKGERIYGEGVNIAARMENLADKGGICISGAVYDQVKQKLDFKYNYLGEQKIKHIKEPVRAYWVLSLPGTAAHRFIKAKMAINKSWRNFIMALSTVLIIGATLAIGYFYFPTKPSVEKPPYQSGKVALLASDERREKELKIEMEKQMIAAEQKRIEDEKRALEAKEKQEKEALKIEMEEQRIAVERKQIEEERKALESKRRQGEKIEIEMEKQKIAAERKRIEDEKRALEADKRKIISGFKMAIFPGLMNNSQVQWISNKDVTIYIQDALNEAISSNRLFVPKFSYYDLKNIRSEKIRDDILSKNNIDNLWLKRSFSKVEEPNIDLICQLGEKLQVDAILMYNIYVYNESHELFGNLTVSLINVKTKKIYSEKETSSIRWGLDRNLNKVIKKLYINFEKDSVGNYK